MGTSIKSLNIMRCLHHKTAIIIGQLLTTNPRHSDIKRPRLTVPFRNYSVILKTRNYQTNPQFCALSLSTFPAAITLTNLSASATMPRSTHPTVLDSPVLGSPVLGSPSSP